MESTVTHAWLRRLSDYSSGGVSVTERAAVEAHLATCIECQQALVAYRRFDALVRSPLRLGDGSAGALPGYRVTSRNKQYRTLAVDDRRATEEETMITNESDRDTSRASTVQPRRPRGTLTTLGAIAAVILVAIVSGVVFTLLRARL